MKTIFVKEFSEFPGPRYRNLGPCSGEEFREEILVPAIKQYGAENLVIDLDGTCGYGSSFLEEAFGGLLRDRAITPDEAVVIVENLVSDEDPSLIDEIREYIADESGRGS